MHEPPQPPDRPDDAAPPDSTPDDSFTPPCDQAGAPPVSPGHTAVLGPGRPARVRDAGSIGWARVAAVVATILVGVVAFVQRPEESVKPPSAQTRAGMRLEGSDEMAILGRLLVKFKHALPPQSGADQAVLIRQLDTTPRSPADKLRAAIVAGELGGADAALERLAALRQQAAPESESPAPADAPPAEESPAAEESTPPTQEQPGAAPAEPATEPAGAGAEATPDLTPDLEALDLIYSGRVAELTEDQRHALVERHGWFGRLALSYGLPDADPARAPLLKGGAAILVLFIVFGLAVLGAGLAGLVLFIIAMVMLGSRRLRPRFVPPAPGGSVYLETFAVFLAAFLAMGLLDALVARLVPKDSEAAAAALMGARWLLMLILLYPLLRGVDWGTLRHGIGWTRGRGVVREMGAGIVGYLAGLPIFVIGVIAALSMFLLKSLITGQHEPPKNPLFERLAAGGPVMLLIFFLMATLWAPLVEEGVMRGCLYRHLRGRWNPLLAGMISAFAFGIIHPVPVLLTPPLMALGFNFAMIREWRGSLIGPMTAHCLHNAVILTLIISLLTLVGD